MGEDEGEMPGSPRRRSCPHGAEGVYSWVWRAAWMDTHCLGTGRGRKQPEGYMGPRLQPVSSPASPVTSAAPSRFGLQGALSTHLLFNPPRPIDNYEVF
jgi:hypothetical protein